MIQKLVKSNFAFMIPEFVVENEIHQKSSFHMMYFFGNPALVNRHPLKQTKSKNGPHL